jgi:hypothetical protein
MAVSRAWSNLYGRGARALTVGREDRVIGRTARVEVPFLVISSPGRAIPVHGPLYTSGVSAALTCDFQGTSGGGAGMGGAP